MPTLAGGQASGTCTRTTAYWTAKTYACAIKLSFTLAESSVTPTLNGVTPRARNCSLLWSMSLLVVTSFKASAEVLPSLETVADGLSMPRLNLLPAANLIESSAENELPACTDGI